MPRQLVQLVKTIDRLETVLTSIKVVTSKAVYAGVPQEKAERDNVAGQQPKINNATIAYIMEHGSPMQNIPARPFMRPAISAIQPQIRHMLKQGTEKALQGDKSASERALNQVGLLAQRAIQAKITEGPFEPLSPRTIAARIRRRQAGRKLIKQVGEAKAVAQQIAIANGGAGAAIVGTKPLIDTGQLRRSISYVVRDR